MVNSHDGDICTIDARTNTEGIKDLIRRLSGKSCWLDVEPVFSGRSADSIFGRQHTRSRINKLYLLAYLHTMALSFFISLFVTYTDIANRQTTNIFFGFLGSHSSDAREKKTILKSKLNLYRRFRPERR